MQNLKSKNIKWWLGTMSFVLLFSVITIFSYEKMCFLVKGVKIEADIEQKDGSSIATISGNANKATYIALNGREIFIDKTGNFSEVVAILPGYSVITLNAKDKFGKTDEKKFEMVKKENAPAIALNKN